MLVSLLFSSERVFFENQGKQKNQTSRFMLFVRLGGMTCFIFYGRGWSIGMAHSKSLQYENKRILFSISWERKYRFWGGRSAYLTERNLACHVQIVGDSGSGKTNLLKLAIEDRVAKRARGCLTSRQILKF